MRFLVGKRCKHVLKIRFTLFLKKSVFRGIQMLLKFTEIRGVGHFAACGPWTLAGKISND